ncbi:MAG: AMP-binding protein [Syntrophales bacterium]|jgi:long-chain acyl-CoA synthetase|nr:AMP-binding protein [Syntrophales bacterium]HOG07361.1 AMP-binding protein [Syntrophales bacterium]HOS77918.1 AMP-binding protein [Syntrophales bacterium]HPB70117.1 AMP-binding protein [Syntrophales bacterium]HQP29267.1 AMP-binding protein [Syntrophales bacterium]
MSDVYTEKPWLKNYDKNVPPTLKYEDKTFAEMFRKAVEAFPDKTALHYMGKKLTFRDLDLLSNQLAQYLLKIGLKPDDVVGMHMPNIPAHYLGLIAVQKAGCVSTGLSPLLTPHEMEHQLTDSRAKVVMTVDVLFEKVAEVAGKTPFSTVIVAEIADFLPGVKRVLGKLLKKIPTAPIRPLPGKTVLKFMEAIRGMPTDRVAVKRTMDDTIFMMYTGGTTGPSKGAILTQRGYMYNRLQTCAWLDIGSKDVALSAFPLFHIAGLALGGFTMTSGATQICVPNPRDSHFLIGAIKAYKPTMIVNVPTVFFELLKVPEFKALDLSNLNFCLSAAAPFPAEYIAELEKIIGAGNFIELYGMTEMSPVMCCNPRYGKKKASSIGMPMPDTEFRLIDPETGQPAKLGEPGEIVARGPQLMKEYYEKPEETANAVRDGWMYTGDVAKMDEDGYFYLVDRVKDMVIVSGFKVFTRELDDLLATHPDVDVAATIGVPDPARPGSERVAIAIVLKPGVDKSEAEKEKLTKFLKENVAPYKVPKVIQFMDALPTSGVGKVLKRELRKMM